MCVCVCVCGYFSGTINSLIKKIPKTTSVLKTYADTGYIRKVSRLFFRMGTFIGSTLMKL